MQGNPGNRADRPAEVIDQLAALAGYRERLRSLRDHRFQPSAELAEALSAKARPMIREDPAKAGEWARLAAAVSREVTDPHLWIDARRILAQTSLVRGNFRSAHRVLLLARSAALGLGEERLCAELDALRIQALVHLERHDEAEQVGRRALERFESESDRGGSIRVHMALADLAYRRDAPREALRHYARVDALRSSEAPESLVATIAANRGNALEACNRFRGAMRQFDSARSIFERRGAEQVVAQVDYNTAYAEMLRGRYQEALTRLTSTEEVFLRLKDERHLAHIALDRAEIHVQLCLFEDAEHFAADAEERFHALGLVKDRAEAKRLRGVAKENLGDLAGAEACQREAARIFEELGLLERRISCLVHCACVAERAGRGDEAEEIAVEAEGLVDPEMNPLTTASLGLLRARIALRSGNPGLAHRLASVVADGTRRVLAPLVQIEALRIMGQADRRRGQLKAAIGAYRKAIDSLENHRVGVPPDEYMASYLAGKSELYGEIVDLLVSVGDEETAFEFTERAKSRALVDLLARGAKQSGQDLSVYYSQRLRYLRERLSAVYQRLHKAGSEPEARSFRLLRKAQREAAELERRIGGLLRSARMHGLEAASLEAVSTMDIAAIRRGIGEGTVLLEYLLTGDRLFTFVLTRDHLHVVRQEVDPKELHDAMERFRFHLAEAQVTKPEEESLPLDSMRGNLRRLSRMLLEPVKQHLVGRRLLVIPHGMLHRLPFHALPWEEGWLIDRFEVVYSPSATVHGFCVGRKPTASCSAAVFGLPDEQAPQIEDEARMVAKVLQSSRLYLRSDATLERLREEVRDSRIVHIATHGMFRSAQPMLSSILLAEGWVNLYDLYGLEVHGELVVLATCESGTAGVTGGDEVLGLTRAFLFAGAPALMTSQWPISDAVTTKFMRRFYRELDERGEAGAAYRATLCALRRAHPHPYFWAPFFLTGHPVERVAEEEGALAVAKVVESTAPLVEVRA